VRTDLKCPYPDCNKGDGCLTRGDKRGIFGFGTFYSAKDVHPQDTKNKYKHRSQGVERYCWNTKIASAYASCEKVASDALKAHAELVLAAGKHGKWRPKRQWRPDSGNAD